MTNDTVSTTWQPHKLGQELGKLSDKDKVKLLLKTINDNNGVETLEAASTISFCTGYLGALLVMHNLYDWEG